MAESEEPDCRSRHSPDGGCGRASETIWAPKEQIKDTKTVYSHRRTQQDSEENKIKVVAGTMEDEEDAGC